MKALFLIPIFVGCAATAASAADIATRPTTKAPIVAPIYNWSGFYAGVHAGYGWSNQDVTIGFSDPGGLGSIAGAVAAGVVPVRFSPDRSGFIGGGQIGYNHQVSRDWVIGVEADLSGTDWKGSHSIATHVGAYYPVTSSASQNMEWFGTIRARLGYAANNWLFYGTAGGAYGHTSFAYSLDNASSGGPVSIASTDSSTDFGWAAGGGIEYGWGNWSGKVEYLHYDLGNRSFTVALNTAPTASFTPTFQNKGDLVRVGLNYRFR